MAVETLTEESTSRYVQAGDVRLHYNEAGTGHSVIAIHGGGPGATGWSNYRTNIGPLSEHFHTMLMDMPQYGKSDPVVIQEESVSFNAKAIKAALDSLGIEKVHLIGNSMGGATSMRFATMFPERLAKLVLMGPAGGRYSPFTPQPLEGLKALFKYWDEPTRENMKEIVDLFVHDESLKTEELVDRRHNAALAHPEHMEARRKSSGGRFDGYLIAHLIQAPTLIIWGREDRFSPLDFGLHLVSRIPNAQFHMFPGCGHWCQYEKSDEFNRLVIDFFTHDD